MAPRGTLNRVTQVLGDSWGDACSVGRLVPSLAVGRQAYPEFTECPPLISKVQIGVQRPAKLKRILVACT